MVDLGRRYLAERLPDDLEAYLVALEAMAAPLRTVVAGARIPDPDDRLQAVRFTLALHGLEAAILDGSVDEDRVDNAVYMEYAQLEEALEGALPPKPGFSARSQPAGGGATPRGPIGPIDLE